MTAPENLFEAKVENLSRTMGAHAAMVGFVIPDYQHSYDRKIDKIKRLLEDCLSGFDNYWRTKDSTSYTFLGTIILVNEKQAKEHSFDGTSLAVVDGQQRLTTLGILCCVLVEALVRHQDDMASLKEATRRWLKEEVGFHTVALFADRVLLCDLARSNLSPDLDEQNFRQAIRSLLANIPISSAILRVGEDKLLTRLTPLRTWRPLLARTTIRETSGQPLSTECRTFSMRS